MTLRNIAWSGCVMLALAGVAAAQGSPGSSLDGDGTSLVELIEAVSKKTGKSFIVDPRVSGNARLIGMEPSKLTYAELLTVLQVHGYAAIESGNIVRVIPEAESRSSPTPLIKNNERRADSERVTRIIKVKSVPAAQLVPVMRSLLPQSAHLAAMVCTNELIVVDSYANVRRIEALVAELDQGDPLQLEQCTTRPQDSYAPTTAPGSPRTPRPIRQGE